MKSLTQAKTICQIYAKNKFYSQAKFFCAYTECYKKNDLFSIPGRDFHLQEKKKKQKNYQNKKINWNRDRRGKKKATETMTYQDRVWNKCKQPV